MKYSNWNIIKISKYFLHPANRFQDDGTRWSTGFTAQTNYFKKWKWVKIKTNHVLLLKQSISRNENWNQNNIKRNQVSLLKQIISRNENLNEIKIKTNQASLLALLDLSTGELGTASAVVEENNLANLKKYQDQDIWRNIKIWRNGKIKIYEEMYQDLKKCQDLDLKKYQEDHIMVKPPENNNPADLKKYQEDHNWWWSS